MTAEFAGSHAYTGTSVIYGYRGTFDIEGEVIKWRAKVTLGARPAFEADGELELPDPAARALAVDSIKARINRRIDAL